jgi:AraC-like DNA-binding protein
VPQDSPRLPVFQYRSTDEVPWTQRLDYWSSILSDVLIPMTIGSDDKRNFSASMVTTSFGPLRVTRCQGSAHDSWRTRQHVERSQNRFFHLVISLESSWRFSHRGRTELQRGDLILNDSQYEHEVNIRSRYDILSFQLPVDWVLTWVAEPERLVGRRISKNSPWGTVLSPALSQLRPDFVAGSPVAPGVLADHVGALLALVAGQAPKPYEGDQRLVDRIADCIRQRCNEPRLTAEQVALSLEIEPVLLHHVLASTRQTFATQLRDARLGLALRLLVAPSERGLSLTAIAGRAGFSELLHLDRAMRTRCGYSASEFRRQHQLPAGDGADKRA